MFLTCIIGNQNNFYVLRWLETQHSRGSNEIISCLIHFLTNVVAPLIQEKKIKCIRFFCDSCTGQNKNYSAALALMNFCHQNNATFEWFFPVKGHSYMPADRAFSLAERHMKKRQMILEPKEYDEILESCGNLTKLGQDFPLRDYAAVASNALKVCTVFSQCFNQILYCH